jgi:hypothetical protein
MVTTLHDAPAQQLDHGQVEKFLETSGRELLRRMVQGYLDHRAATEPKPDRGAVAPAKCGGRVEVAVTSLQR